MRYLNYFENVHLKCTNFFGRKLISAEVFFAQNLPATLSPTGWKQWNLSLTI